MIDKNNDDEIDEENPESVRKLKDIKVNIQTESDDDVGEENMYTDKQKT